MFARQPRDNHGKLSAAGEAASRRRSAIVYLWLPALIGATGLALLALLVQFALALAIACLALWFALLRLVLTFRRERVAVRGQTEEIRTNYESIIALLSGALGLQDSVTADQAQRISQLAAVVARQMKLRKDDIRHVEQAAVLHDIGRIGIAEEVLAKPGALSEHEWSQMKRHPDHGYQILNGIDPLRDIAEIVYAHHERYDGTGYPRGLRGDQIPLGSRIFAVVDAYAAMTSNRPYRKTMPHEVAVKEIIRNTLTQFDPQVVRAFVEADKQGLIQRPADDPLGQMPRAAVPSEV